MGGTVNALGLDPAGSGDLRLVSVQIVNGINNAPDQIISFYGNSVFRVSAETVLGGSTPNVTKLNSRAGFNSGDVVILANGAFTDCRILEVTSTDPLVLLTDKAIGHDTVAYQSFYKTLGKTSTPVFNPAAGIIGPAFASAINLGPAPQANQWRISTTNPNSAQNPALQRFSIFPIDGAYPTPRAREVAEGVVNLQAQYGYDANGDGQISATEWVDANATNAPDLAGIGGGAVDWRRVLAVRYAILARSRNYEPAPYAATKPTWVGAIIDPAKPLDPPGFTMTDIGGATDTNPDGATNWRRYRYLVAEGVIPIRNALWGRGQ